MMISLSLSLSLSLSRSLALALSLSCSLSLSLSLSLSCSPLLSFPPFLSITEILPTVIFQLVPTRPRPTLCSRAMCLPRLTSTTHMPSSRWQLASQGGIHLKLTKHKGCVTKMVNSHHVIYVVHAYECVCLFLSSLHPELCHKSGLGAHLSTSFHALFLQNCIS